MPQTAADREAVREQLGRLVSSALFRNSKRFPAFLQYTVEHALTSTDSLKERTIGHEAFGRDPSYDTSQDPVVRMTAAEVRRRLTQYYQQPEHQDELVIAYEPGSYLPEFFVQVRQPPAEAAASRIGPQPAVRTGSSALQRWTVAAVAVVVLVAVSAVIIATKKPAARAGDAIGRFWMPILDSRSPVLICIGDPSAAGGKDSGPGSQSTEDLSISEFLRSNSVRYTDALTLALIAGELRARDKAFTIRRPQATDLMDLRDGPVVLIGGFNNPWTLRLSEGLRFTLASDAGGAYVRDRESPDSRKWQRTSGNLIRNLTRTYGLITRVRDPATGQAVLSISGLVFGTATAGECLIDDNPPGAEQRRQHLNDRVGTPKHVARDTIRRRAGLA